MLGLRKYVKQAVVHITQIPENVRVEYSNLAKDQGLEIAHTMTSGIKRRGRCSNKRDKRLNEALHHKPGELWSEAKKLEAVTYFIVLGKATEVEKFTGIPSATISSWKKQEWWQEMTQQVRSEKNEELDAKLTGILDNALVSIVDRLEDGDTKYVPQHDKFVKVPLTARDLAMNFGILYDKRAMLRGEAIRRVEHVSTDTRLNRLLNKFESFANAKEIEGEVIEDDEVNS